MVESTKMRDDRKAQLIAELEWSRSELARNLRSVHGDLDVPSRFRHSVVHRTTAWLGGAALAGWILSRLPSRRKKPKPAALPGHDKGWMKGAGRTGILLATLNALFNLSKPFIATFARRKIQQMASRSEIGLR
jgi:hypothetical protein